MIKYLTHFTAKQAIFLFSTFAGIINFLILWQTTQLYWWQAGLVSLLVMGVNLSVLLFILEFFFFRRIKQLYKNIAALKTNSFERITNPETDKKYDDPLENIGHQILELSHKSREEIQKLKALEQYRKEFIGNVSHELKTPIFAVQGYIDTLLDGAIDDPKFNRKFLEKALSNAERLVTLVQDLMSISQLETGQLQMEMKPFLFLDLLWEVVETFEMESKSRKITIQVFNVDKIKGIIVMADRERIRQVLVNLIANSLRYGKSNGETSIHLKLSTKKIQISIADNGIGIASEHLERVFERFYRVEKSRSRESGGTGLGLSIVKHILEAHNEPISVQSELGLGTTFSFKLDRYVEIIEKVF